MNLPDDISLHLQWQTENPEIAEKAISLWRELSVLPEGIDPEERAKQLVYCALNRDGKVVAVTTASKEKCPFINLPMLFMRYLVHPDYRMHGIGEKLYVSMCNYLHGLAVDGEYMGCKGLAARVINRSVQNHYTHAVLEKSQTVFIGYTEKGDRIRVRYFDGARIDY